MSSLSANQSVRAPLDDHFLEEDHSDLSLSSDTASCKIIGLYGVSGSGKTTLLHQLRQKLNNGKFVLRDGSDILKKVLPAIRDFGTECKDAARDGIVAGHGMLWDKTSGTAYSIWTEGDTYQYDHIIYLQQAPAAIYQRCTHDTTRRREVLKVSEYDAWQKAGMAMLKQLCYRNGILFSVLRQSAALEHALELVNDTHYHSEAHNLTMAKQRLAEMNIPHNRTGMVHTALVLDGGKTLAPQDTGLLFWRAFRGLSRPIDTKDDPLKEVFATMGYTYAAFRQVMMLYESYTDDAEYDHLCSEVAATVTMYPEFLSLLQFVAQQNSKVVAMVITSGLKRVREEVLHREGLAEVVKVLGGGRISDGFVVTADVKAHLVERIQKHHFIDVWTFGDSPLDLAMCEVAYQAVVVVGDENERSRSMEVELAKALESGLRGRNVNQVVFPHTATPRLDTTRLPLLDLTSYAFVDDVFGRGLWPNNTPVYHATAKSAAKLLMTPTRDKSIQGPALQKGHRRIGWYLAIEYLSLDEVLGLEEHPIRHVDDSLTVGHRFRHEHKITVIALMRGGEPMAFGVTDAMPTAMFLHAKEPSDVKGDYIKGQYAVVLVDSVVNSGETVLKFIEHIRGLHATIRIMVVAGVIQNKVIDEGRFKEYANVKVVALRLSQNKYTGRGGTDTGNRLFNTTQLV